MEAGKKRAAAARVASVLKGVHARTKGKPMHLGIVTMKELRALERELGPEFREWIGPRVLAAYKAEKPSFEQLGAQLRAQFAAMVAPMAPIGQAMQEFTRSLQEMGRNLLENPRVQQTMERLKRAEAGDRPAILGLLREDPLEALQISEISRHIEKPMYGSSPGDREFLVEVADAFRRGLIKPRRKGRPKIVDMSKAILARTLQSAFDAHRSEFRRLPRRLDLRRGRVADLLTPDLVEFLPDQQETLVDACLAVIADHPRVRGAFGIEVAGRVFGCTPRSIASVMRTLKLGKK